jgi:hypothetical protein
LAEAADAAAQRTALEVLPFAGGTLTGQLIQSVNGAESTPPVLLSGTIFTGGSATTTKPALLIEPTGTTSTGWSTGGTGLGVNLGAGFAGVLMSLQIAGVQQLDFKLQTKFGINNMPSIEGSGGGAGQIFFNGTNGNVILGRKDVGWTFVSGWQSAFVPSDSSLGFSANAATVSATTVPDAFWSRVGSAHIAHGAPLASTWVNQALSAAGAIVGTTTNGSPTNTFTITGSISTGTGTGGDLKFGVYGTNGASGTAIGTLNTVLTINAARKVLNVAGIPTSSAGLSAGDIYSNLGILTVV